MVAFICGSSGGSTLATGGDLAAAARMANCRCLICAYSGVCLAGMGTNLPACRNPISFAAVRHAWIAALLVMAICFASLFTFFVRGMLTQSVRTKNYSCMERSSRQNAIFAVAATEPAWARRPCFLPGFVRLNVNVFDWHPCFHPADVVFVEECAQFANA